MAEAARWKPIGHGGAWGPIMDQHFLFPSGPKKKQLLLAAFYGIF